MAKKFKLLPLQLTRLDIKIPRHISRKTFNPKKLLYTIGVRPTIFNSRTPYLNILSYHERNTQFVGSLTTVR